MRGVVLLSGVLAAGLATAAIAQDVDVTVLQMKACTLIKDDAARVRCYDQTMSRPASEPAMVGIGSEPALVAIPQSPTTVPQSPTVVPQSSTTIPQLPSTTRSDPAADAPATAKSESSGIFGVNTIIRAITPSAVTALTQPGTGKDNDWQVKADKSVLQQASRLVGTLKSADEKATLVLQCKESSTQASVSTYSFLGWETVRVLYRMNDNPMTESRWPVSSDGRAAIASNATEFINSLGDGGTLYVRLVDYGETSHDLKFNLGAIANLRSQIATVCRWPGAVTEEKLAVEQTRPTPRTARPKPAVPTAVGPPLQLH